MTQSVLNRCPVTKNFFFCISLKNGTLLISFYGMFISFCLSLLMFSPAAHYFEVRGVHPTVANIIVYIYTLTGIILFGAHVMLLLAVIKYNESFLLIYLWVGIGYFCVDVVISIVVIIGMLIKSWVVPAVFLTLWTMCYWNVMYFFIFEVVNSFRLNAHTVVVVLQ